MNKIVEKRIEQFIATKFLKTEAELTLVSFLVKTIEADYKICAKQGYQRFKEHVAMYIFFL